MGLDILAGVVLGGIVFIVWMVHIPAVGGHGMSLIQALHWLSSG